MKNSEGKKPRKTIKRRADLDRPYCNRTWSKARFRSFIMSALRGARWNPKLTVIDRAFTRHGINPLTGMPCKLHRCESCGEEFPRGKMKADHVNEVIPIDHEWEKQPNSFLGYDWNEVMRRLWIEKGTGWNVICEGCHHAKTQIERLQRQEFKKNKASTIENIS